MQSDAAAGPRFSLASSGIAAVYRVPPGCAALLVIGATAALTHSALSAGWVLALVSVVVAAVGFTGDPGTTLFVAGAAWLTVAGFSRAPYAQLRFTAETGWRAGLVLILCAAAATGAGALVRRIVPSVRLWVMELPDDMLAIGDATALSAANPVDEPGTGTGSHSLTDADLPPDSAPGESVVRPSDIRGRGLDRKRQIAGVLLVGVLPLLTLALLPARGALSLQDDLMIYLVAVVGVAVVGGWRTPARRSASAAACGSDAHFASAGRQAAVWSPRTTWPRAAC